MATPNVKKLKITWTGDLSAYNMKRNTKDYVTKLKTAEKAGRIQIVRHQDNKEREKIRWRPGIQRVKGSVAANIHSDNLDKKIYNAVRLRENLQ